MPNYKKHILTTILFTLPLFPNTFSLALAIIGTSIPDFDHDQKQKNNYITLIIGITLTTLLYLTHQNIIPGILTIILSLVLIIPEHRGFTHTILGAIIISIITATISLSILNLLLYLKIPIKIILITLLLAPTILFINKKIQIPFIILYTIGIYLSPINNTPLTTITPIAIPNLTIHLKTIILIALPIFTGIIHHILLDSTTPQGTQALKPFSKNKITKKTAKITLTIWVILLIIILFLYYLPKITPIL